MPRLKKPIPNSAEVLKLFAVNPINLDLLKSRDVREVFLIQQTEIQACRKLFRLIRVYSTFVPISIEY